jgi:acetyl-CoA C-acetyltransferase
MQCLFLRVVRVAYFAHLLGFSSLYKTASNHPSFFHFLCFMSHTVILSAVRTPIGSFGGVLSSFTAPQLGAIAIREAIAKSTIDPASIDEVIVGQVLQAGVGQAPGRQASMLAGIPVSVAVTTINKVCSSGLKAVMYGDQAIRSGDAHIVVSAGQESMSNAPYLLPKARNGYRLGHGQVIDSLNYDGLEDAQDHSAMGLCGELCADKYGFTREQQDEYTIRAYKRAQEAQAQGAFIHEMIGVDVESKKGTTRIDADEEPARVQFEKIPTLRPVFKKDGTITVANASSINDGASALVLTSAQKAQELGIAPIARILAQATFAQEPKWFTTAPVGAIARAVEKAGLTINQIDLFEINEAFAAVTMAAMHDHHIPADKVNIHGGAVSLGHPIGASGARILTTLIHALRRHGKRYGVASLCNGGGEATALVIEAL